MSIKHCIIHSLKRPTEGGEISLKLRDAENTPEGPIVSLFTQLKQSFQRSAQRQYGLFDPEQSDNPLPGWLKQYESESMGFTTVTKKITEHLKSTLEETKDGFSGHLLFAVEELLEESHLYFFWINHTEAQFIDSDLDIDNLEYIDAGKMNYVFKLDFNQWQVENWQQYLVTITSRGNKDLSHAFLQFCGFVSSVNLQQQTDEFLTIVDEYAQTLTPQDSKQYKNKIVEYCVEQDMQGNPINLKDLSGELNSTEPEHFSDFVKDKQEDPKEQIYAHRNSLKKFVRFYGREKDLSISFSSDMMGENVIYNPESGELTLKLVPKSLKQQLAKYLKRDE
ncbi:nucleoid-associated protein [Aliikangiella coralliicola]|uniref:Nucleoid-associated protein NdpA n=1 Tax=Aliikangiella coralliicola TaxID=2592383 RepID=A0A545U7E9_9GAMM|nr:nucleoid-associated protein [Aliikangiella coralliicola]TQV85396.1 nucleoid-associated protein NdpA [Aliikangiella coralliicola]